MCEASNAEGRPSWSFRGLGGLGGRGPCYSNTRGKFPPIERATPQINVWGAVCMFCVCMCVCVIKALHLPSRATRTLREEAKRSSKVGRNAGLKNCLEIRHCRVTKQSRTLFVFMVMTHMLTYCIHLLRQAGIRSMSGKVISAVLLCCL